LRFYRGDLAEAVRMTVFQGLRRKSILLLDPDPWTRDSLSILLAWEDCRLASFETVEEGRRAISTCPFDLVLAAHRVPGLDGIEFLGFCRKQSPGTVRILMGPRPDPAAAEEARRSGVQGWLPKPLTIESLERTIGEAMAASSRTAR
jgi:two-component system response regulator YesN